MPRLTLAFVLVVASLGPAPAAVSDSDLIRRVEVTSTRADLVDEVRRSAETLLGHPAEPRRLVDLVRRLEKVEGVGGVDLETRPRSDGLTLVVSSDSRARHTGALIHVLDGAVLPEAESWRRARRVDAATQGLHLWAGERFHPYLARLDAQTLLDYDRERGYREARVELSVELDPAVAEVGYLITRGPRYRVSRVGIHGFGDGPPGLRTRVGEPFAPGDLRDDLARLERALCRRGYPRARLSSQQAARPPAAAGDRDIALDFFIERGPKIRLGRVQVAGRRIPWGVVRALPLVEGGPYCPGDVEAARVQLAEFLRDHGVPDPRIEVHTRTRLDPRGRRYTSVTFEIRSLDRARIDRIWFSGNEVTRRDVLLQLSAVNEGEIYRQSEIDRTVQALRRSGLFQKVRVRVLEGARPDHVYVNFVVVERKLLSVDVVARRLRLHNLDVSAWPEDMEAVELGQAFRGAGQQVDLHGHPNRLGLAWRDHFIERWFLARTGLLRKKSNTSAFEEIWYALDLGFGVQGYEGAVAMVAFGEAEWTFTEQRGDTDLPVLDGEAITLAGGLEGRFDLNRRDEERIPYLGIDGTVRGRGGGSVAGTEFTWGDYLAEVRGHLPLWRTERGQHFVLRLRVRNRAVFADSSGKLQPHQRLFPGARGYGGDAVGLDFVYAAPLTEEDEGSSVRLGGLHAADATAELRIPIPFGRRNAVSPFFDAGFVADDPDALFDETYPSAGMALSFSLFGERLEGVFWGAYPLRADVPHEYVGATIGGNF